MSKLEIRTGYEGSNPQDAANVERLGAAAFRVCPESEDGDSVYKFCCDVTVENPGDEAAAATLTLDWQEPPEVGDRHLDARTSLFVRGESGWREHAGRTEGDRAIFEITVPPGSTRVCVAPAYGSEELEAFFGRALALPDARRCCFGQTAEGRLMEAAVLAPAEATELCLVAIGTVHPYERGGSWFVDGIADLLAGPRGGQLRRRVGFVLAPMANPDGVAHGYCKRTTTGCELSSEGNRSSDPTACSLRGLLAGVAAAAPRRAFIDAHNWMHRYDGLFTYSPHLAAKLEPVYRGEAFPGGVKVTERLDLPVDCATGDLRQYADGVLGFETIITSTPWFGRTPETARRAGAAVTEAFVEAVLAQQAVE